jgi:acetate kinase
MKILVINSGSSSLKYQVIDMETNEMLVKGNYERIGQAGSFLTHKVQGVKRKFEHEVKNHEEAIQFIISRILNRHYGVIKSLDELAGIGHRVVHGGEKFTKPVIITEEVISEIEKCSSLAPLHNPSALAGIKACQKVVPQMKMVAVFDTAFHQTIPKERYIYPIPYEYYEKYGIRKYGFHGISHQYVAERIAKLMNKDIKNLKIISCHLGQGASLCAIKNGESQETTMGLTPLGGIPMGSRSGDLDPSVVTYLIKKSEKPTIGVTNLSRTDHKELTANEIEEILNKKSGIYGISRISLDFRDVELDSLSGGHHAKLALDVFDYKVAGEIAKMAVAIGGVDVITFEAGVGEKGPLDRKHICEYLKVLGVEIDEELNNVKAEEREISKPTSKVKVWIVPTNEELMIAKETYRLVK